MRYHGSRNNTLRNTTSGNIQTQYSTCNNGFMMPVTEQARLETEIGEYFIGNSGEVNVSMNGNGVVLFCNPLDSGVILNINYGEYDNYSASNVKIAVSSYGYVDAPLKKSRLITSSLIGNAPANNKAQIYTGSNVEIVDDEVDRILLLPSYQYKQVGTNGTIMLQPGGNRIYEITTIDNNGPAVVSIEFEWWEQPTCEIMRPNAF